MRELRMIMKLDGRTFSIGASIEKGAKLVEYTEVLNAINKAMLRLIKKKYFNFSKSELIADCLGEKHE